MLVSVIIRSYNRHPSLLELLQRIKIQTYSDFEVIIIDQTDENSVLSDLTTYIEENHWINYIKFSRPIGGPNARNEGIKRAKGDIVFFIDDDDLPYNSKWISDHVAHYSNEKIVGVTGRHISNKSIADPYLKFLIQY